MAFCILYTEYGIARLLNLYERPCSMASLSRIAATPDLTDQVYQRLLYAICDGELAPGARLTQEALAATLGVSRQPVLQALRLLKKDGFVSDAGRRGLRVTPFE